MKSKNIIRCILLAIVIPVGLYFLSSEIEPKADTLWLHYAGYEAFEPARAQDVTRDLLPASDYEKLETKRREVMRWNYLIHLVSERIGALSMPDSLPTAISIGMALPFLLGVLVFGSAAVAAEAAGPLALTTSVFALTALLPGPSPTDHLLFYDPARNVLNLIALLANPGGAFSPLSVQPKSTVLLLVLAVLALRRVGKRRLGYALVGVSGLWHVSFACVVFGLFVAADVLKYRLLRREITDSALVAALSVLSAGLCALVYVGLRTDMVWGIESAFIQLSARLLVLAEVACVGWAGFAAWEWLGDALGARREAFLSVVCGFVALMSVYAAAGAWWEHGRYYATRFNDPAVAASHGPIAAYYDQALRRLVPTR